ncbi:unnamed protein product [Symbiodinium sp. CCMP2592]|nr:unnamed protein product [Symbiodinium sp. CCMP2592]
MVTSSGCALLAALLPWIVCSVRGILESEGSDPEEVPKDEDRLECLRQDNLDLVGEADFASRYILRQVLGVNDDDTESDVYLFADKFRISRIQAELKISRTGTDALAFELVGSNSTAKHAGLGSADMRIRELQLLTESTVISCATSLAISLASSDCDDPEEQQATVLFDLAGTIRAKKRKGRWEAEIVTKEVRYFNFGFQNKKVLAFTLSWLPSPIEDEIKKQLFELVETTIPIQLLASLQFLPREDHWLTGSMKLLGNMTEANGPLKVWSSLDVTVHTMPTRIPGILNKTFTLEELAAAFLSDPKMARALSNLIENLPQFRYVIGDRLKSVMEKVNYESPRSARMQQIRKISNELSVQFLQPFLKARVIGSKAADLRGLNAHLAGGVSWNSSDNGLARASFHPKELKLQAGSGEDGNPLYSLAQAPLGLLEDLALTELLPKLPVEGELAEVEFRDLEYNPNHISLALAAIRNWAQKPDASANATAKWQIILAEAKAIALRLPQALSLPFGISCKGGKIAIDHSGRIQFLSARNGVEVSQTRPMVRPLRDGAQRGSGSGFGEEAWDARLPAEFQRPTTSQLDMTVVDGIDEIGGSVSLDVAGGEKGSLQIKIGGTLQMKVDAKSLVTSALAGLPSVDFGYAFFADEFSWYNKDWEERSVMAVLSCGYLRLLQWPLRIEKLKRLEMKKGQRQYDLTKLRGYPTFEKDPQMGSCVLVHFSKGLIGSDVTERLCGRGGKAEALYKAVKLQMHRFENGRQVHKAPQAVTWKFGTHVAGKPQYVLPQDKVQANLQTIFKEHTWSKTHGGSGHPALLQAASTSRISSLVAEGREVDIAQHDANTGEEEHRMEAPTPTEKGSFESQACRAQQELDSIRYPPEKYGNASIRMVMPATPIGDVHLLIEKIQVVSFDVVGSLVRNSDTTFSFELGGSDGPGTVNVYVQGMKFKAPDSALPGITQAASADGIEEGPLKATLNMKGEFKLSEGGHWEVLPTAVSDVKLVFGRGGLVQGLINYLMDSYGDLDEIFLTSVWPVLASAIPESLGQAFVQIPRRVGQLRHSFNIHGRCLLPRADGEQCETDQVSIVFQDVTAAAVLPKPLAEKYLVSQNCSKSCEAMPRLHSYLKSSNASVFDGTSTETGLQVDYSAEREFTKILLEGSGVAPMKLVEIGLGNGTNLVKLLPSIPGKLASVGSMSIREGNKVEIPEARLERLRLPLLLDGQKEDLELNLTLKVKATSDGPASSILDTLDGHVDLMLDRVHGLVLQQTGEHQIPLLNITLNRTYVNDIFAAIERAWPQPTNVRTAAAGRPDGEVPEAFRQKQSIVPGELDMHKTVAQAHLGASLTLVGEVDAASGEDLLNVSVGVVLRTTLDLGSAFWRAVVTRREKDFGFVHAPCAQLRPQGSRHTSVRSRPSVMNCCLWKFTSMRSSCIPCLELRVLRGFQTRPCQLSS